LLALRIFVMASAVLALTASSASAEADRLTPAERMIEEINDVRDRHGLHRLREAPKLTQSSRGYATHLIQADSFGHGSSYREAGFRTSGEILAMRRGWSRRPLPTLRMWLRSPGHAAVILEPAFRYIGASPASGRYGDALTTVWVAQFGAH
jgi:uncharacterized protein YkwD